MNTQNRFKQSAIGAVVASVLLFTSCGGPATLPKADPKEILQSARTNMVQDTIKELEDQLMGVSNAKIDLDATFPEGNIKGTINLDAENKTGKEETSPSALGAKINASLQGTVEKIAGSADLAFEVKILDKVLYFFMDKFDVQTADAAMKENIAQAKTFIDLYSKKWFKLDLAALAPAGTPAISTGSYAESVKVISLLKEHEIFEVVKELPSADGMYIYQVKPSVDGGLALLKALVALSPAKTEWTAADESSVKELLTQLGGENITHTLYIDGASKKYKKFVSQGKLDNEEVNGTLELTLTSPKDMEFDLNLKVAITDKADAKKTVSIIGTAKGSGKQMNGTLDIDAPNENVKVSVKGNTSFQKKEVTIVAPEGASDFAQMLGLFGLGSGSGTEMSAPSDVTPTNMNTEINGAIDSSEPMKIAE